MKIIYKEEAYLIRPSSGEFDDDMNWVTVNQDPVCFKCSIQPELEGFRRVVEESGARSEDFIRIYTKTKLQSSDEGKTVVGSQGQAHDIIEVDEENYVPFKVLKWRGARKLSHYDVLLIKEDAFGKLN